MTRRAILLGLDGANLGMLEGLAANGVLPNVQSLFTDGGRANLRSTIPMYTLPSWTTCFTGVDPAVHEVLYWRGNAPWLPWRDDTDEPFGRLPMERLPHLWDMVESMGRFSGSLDIPLGFPAPKVKGFFTGGFLAPHRSPRLAHPPDLLRNYPSWEPEVIKTVPSQELRADPGGRREYLRRLTEQTSLRRAFLRDHVDPVDLLSIVNVVPDRLSHLHWEPLVRLARGEGGEQELIDCWTEVDGLVGDLRARLGPADTLIVVSDHGFAPSTYFNVARWLADVGFIGSVSGAWLRIQRAVAKGIPGDVRRRAASRLRRSREIPEFMPVSASGPVPNVWPRILDDRGCYLYLSPSIGNASLRRDVAARIVQAAQIGRGIPEGIAPLERVALGEAEFPGVHDVVMPDVVMIPADGWALRDDFSEPRLVIPMDDEASHHRDGILVALGPDVPAGKQEAADMRDILPTVLAAMGLEPPGGLPGRRIAWIAAREGSDTVSATAIQGEGDTEVGADEQAEIETHLRGLGYLE
jgi:predicted AlkP superfamily phosphohydrolase/phosphomutase